jgi:hypothetical protein
VLLSLSVVTFVPGAWLPANSCGSPGPLLRLDFYSNESLNARDAYILEATPVDERIYSPASRC